MHRFSVCGVLVLAVLGALGCGSSEKSDLRVPSTTGTSSDSALSCPPASKVSAAIGRPMKVNPDTAPGGCAYIADGVSGILNYPLVTAEIRPSPLSEAVSGFAGDASCQTNTSDEPGDIWCPDGDIPEINVFEAAGNGTRWLQLGWPQPSDGAGEPPPGYERMRAAAVDLLAAMR